MNGTETGSATLAELCDLISEQVHPVDVPEALYVGLEHVIPGRLRRSGGGIARDVQSHKYAFRRNDILYGKLRPYLDKAILADTDGVCTTELLVLRAKPGVDPRFLACLVHDPDFVEHALTGVTGAHHPRTSWAHVAQFECPRFSYEEQQAIAALLWRVQDLLKVCEDALEVAQDLKRAAMRELFTRGLRGEPQKETEVGPVPESWSVETLSSSVQRPDYGFTASAINEPVGPKFLRITDIQDGAVDWSSVPYCAIDNSALEQKRLADGDIVIARIGATTGKAFIIEDAPEAVFASYMIRVRTLPQILLAKFLYYFMQSDAYWRYIDQNKGGRLKGGVNIPALLAMPIICPTLDEQRDIVAILDAIDRKIELHRKKRAVLEELFKALLHKLMTGEIRVDALDLSALQVHAEPLSPSAEPAV